MILKAGFPKPSTQIPVVVDGRIKYYLDMGWEERKLGVEYDGDHHRADPKQYARDIRRLERLQRLGWIVLRVIGGDRPDDIVRRVRWAFESRARG